MPLNDTLGQRMKTYYEDISKVKLMHRIPVAIRIDGKAFHTFTRGFEKPFDDTLTKSMQDTMKYLCENVQGCVFGYTQSDEITLILCDYKTLKTDAWFNYEVQKICSVSASMATMAFNKFFAKNVSYTLNFRESLNFKDVKRQEQEKKYKETLCNAIVQGAMFDARCFNIPKEEVTNLIYWRQLDAIRNSIQMVGQANFSHSQLQGKNCNDIQEMLWTEKHIHWDGYAIYNKRGSACYKTENGVWYVDLQMPILKGRDRWYVESLIDFS